MEYQNYSSRVLGKLENLNKIYAGLMYEKADELTDLLALQTAEHLRTPPKEGLSPLKKGDKWGGEYMNLWIVGSYTLPKALEGKKLLLLPHTDAYETMLFKNGVPDGIFNSKGDYMGIMHSVQLLTEGGQAGECFDLAFECYAHHFCAGCHPYMHYGREVPAAREGEFEKTFRGIEICTVNQELFRFVFDLNVALQMARDLDESNFLKHRAQVALEKVFADIIQYPAHYDKDTVQATVLKCLEHLKPLLAHAPSEDTRGYIGLIGGSHMDTAWLWPVSETIRKCARTYSNVVKLMEQYPEYIFIQSSALHLEWMKDYYPDLYEKMKKYIAEGRYEPNGGVFVECDCNITSGELMARQFMYGQHFTREEFGYTSDCFWLPDTFGYNGAIPQIMQESEVKYFYTTKMGWNDLNEFPFTTFRWKGIDGSTVLTHLNNIDTIPDVKDTKRQIDTIKNKEHFEGRLHSFGHGDGGGGPTPAMLEKARRIMDLPGVAKSRYTTISSFMKEIEQVGDKLPVFSGELYLELHRGTLTQMHEIKRSNRKAEIALHDMDHFNVLAGKDKNERTDALYKTLMTNQFHDILPGTCYTGVTQDAVAQNYDVVKEAGEISRDYAKTLLSSNQGITLFNTTSFDREDVVLLEDRGLYPAGKTVQRYTDVTGKRVAAVGGIAIPAMGQISLPLTSEPQVSEDRPFTVKNGVLETPFAKVSFNEQGGIVSFVDKRSGRELKKEGGAPLNTLYVAEDVPETYDNWDIDIETMGKLRAEDRLLSMDVVSNGALQYVLRLRYAIGKASTLTQDLIFYADTPRVDFHTVVDWKEKHTLLKVGFDLDINSPTVKNEIQFGHMDRPITRNNSYEAAKFEVCNHKWSDLSESRFGVALLNDCKYGISAYEGNLCLTLHRGGTHPDVTGDEGVHEMTYALYPHGEGFAAGNVVRESYLLNLPPVPMEGSAGECAPFMRISTDNVICEAVKPAAYEKDAFVVRLYESERNKTSFTLTLPEGVKRVCRCNILEDVKEELPVVDGKISLTVKPFGILSLMMYR
ncbi:MAG: alpha-mannosidase [Clostridia bacterium]|nr:alpha-mannosidase [Clostridia bacterium]